MYIILSIHFWSPLSPSLIKIQSVPWVSCGQSSVTAKPLSLLCIVDTDVINVLNPELNYLSDLRNCSQWKTALWCTGPGRYCARETAGMQLCKCTPVGISIHLQTAKWAWFVYVYRVWWVVVRWLVCLFHTRGCLGAAAAETNKCVCVSAPQPHTHTATHIQTCYR